MLDHETSEQEFAELVDRAGREMNGQLLAELLPERIPVYRGRSANTVNRMRGYLLAAFESAGLPEELCPTFSRSSRADGMPTWLRRRRRPFEVGIRPAPTLCRFC